MSFIFHPNLIFVMILFFTSLQMVCVDEIDNYVEIVLISCMACTDLDCRKHDTGCPRTNVSIYVQRERRSEDDMIGFFRILADSLSRNLSNITWRKQKNAPSNLQRDHKKRILRPRFSRKICKELFTFVSAMVKRRAG